MIFRPSFMGSQVLHHPCSGAGSQPQTANVDKAVHRIPLGDWLAASAFGASTPGALASGNQGAATPRKAGVGEYLPCWEVGSILLGEHGGGDQLPGGGGRKRIPAIPAGEKERRVKNHQQACSPSVPQSAQMASVVSIVVTVFSAVDRIWVTNRT